MRKTRKASSSAFTPVQNLALSWTPATKDKVSTPNVLISTDWGIINKTAQQGKNNVFALYLDLNTGWLAVYPKENRGLAGRPYKNIVKNTVYLEQFFMIMRKNICTATSRLFAKTKELNSNAVHHTIPTRIQQSTTWI
jgi:hypothetical protein